MINKKILSIEQMNTLIEKSIDISGASMVWDWDEGSKEHVLEVYDSNRWYDTQSIPTFDLLDILGMLPRKIENNTLNITLFVDNICHINYKNICGFRDKNPLLAAYQMLLWCIDNKHIKTKKNYDPN